MDDKHYNPDATPVVTINDDDVTTAILKNNDFSVDNHIIRIRREVWTDNLTGTNHRDYRDVQSVNKGSSVTDVLEIEPARFIDGDVIRPPTRAEIDAVMPNTSDETVTGKHEKNIDEWRNTLQTRLVEQVTIDGDTYAVNYVDDPPVTPSPGHSLMQ
jgi:hypothetical protein